MESASLPRRPESHILEEQSRRAFKCALPAEWVIHDVVQDYGADLTVEIYESSLPTGFAFVVQLKAKAAKEAGKPFYVSVPTATVNYLLQRSVPAMIVGYDALSNTLYYTWLDEYLTAQEFSQRKKRGQKQVRISFSPDAKLAIDAAPRILDYFRPAGVASQRVQELLEKLPMAGSVEREEILQELRFLRTADGVLYLLSVLPVDAILEDVHLLDKSTRVVDAFLQVCLNRPTPAALMLFWGVSAHLAQGEENSYTSMAHRLFDGILPKMLKMSAESLATESCRLFGRSAEAGIRKMDQAIRNPEFSTLAKVLCNRLRPMRATTAFSPTARDLYAALYSVDIVGDTVGYLSDTEMGRLWQFYDEGREEMRLMRDGPREMAVHGRGYFKALNQVYGYQFHLEHESSDADVEALLTCMVVKKVDMFMKLVELKEWEESQDRSKWSHGELVQYAAADLFGYTKMYWYGEALDWFSLPCFCREFFDGGR